MRTISALLVVLAACGGGAVCAGCSDDGAGSVPPALRIMATATASTNPDGSCFNLPEISVRLDGFDTPAPTFTEQNLAEQPRSCSLTEASDGWLVTCEPPTFNYFRFTVAIGDDLSSGTVVAFLDGCTDTYTITAITPLDAM